MSSLIRPAMRLAKVPRLTSYISTSPFIHAEASSSSSSSTLTPSKKPKPAVKNISSCPAGTKFTGLSILKDRPDPVALSDEEYPPWLWNLLDDPTGNHVVSKSEATRSEIGNGQGKEGGFDFKTERKKLRATNRSNIKAQNYLKTT